MRKKILGYLSLPGTLWLCLLLTSLLAGCSKVKEQSDLGEIEMYFDEQLSSLSTEGGSIHWVGSEYGNVWRITAHQQTKYKLASDRIYFVKPYHNGYWVSVRNGGLRFYTLHSGKMVLRTTIMMPEKGKLYSTYDVLPTPEGLLMGTSQGLFLYQEKENLLTKLYPSRLSNRNTFQVNRLIELPHHQGIVAATENGLVCRHPHSGTLTTTHEGEKIGDITLYRGRLLIVAEKQCFLIDSRGREERYELPEAMHYVFPSGNTMAFFGINQAYLTDDLRHFTHVTLRRSIPQKSSHILTYTPGDDYVWMVTDHAVWKIPSHLSVNGADHPMMTSCQDQGTLYFVDTRNNIYHVDKSGTYADKIFDFIKSNSIVSCACHQGRFFYLDNQRRIYSITLGRQLWGNYLTAFQKELFSSKSKVTALHIDSDNGPQQLMIGLQDGLVMIDGNGRTDTLPSLRNQYVTSIFQRDGDPHVYLPTLNDGLYVLQNDRTTKVMNDSTLSPQHVVVTSAFPSDMLIATNDRVFLQGSRDTLMLAGIGKLLMANDTTVYAVLDNGIERLSIRNHHLYDGGHLFSDIHFNPQACQTLNGRLFLGCNLGILTFMTGHELQSSWLPITESKVSRRGLLMSILLLLFIVTTLLAVRHFVYRWSRGELRTRKAELTHRLHDIWPYREIIDVKQREKLEQLREQVYQIHYRGVGSWKQVDKRISTCSDAIMRLNRDVVLSLLRLLEGQIKEITATELFDATALVIASEKAINDGHPDQMGRQALANRQWLQNVADSRAQLQTIEENIRGTLPLKGITDTLSEKIEQFYKDLAIKPLDDLKPLFEDITGRYDTLTSPAVVVRLQQFCQRQVKRLRALNPQDKVMSTLCSQYEEASRRIPEDPAAGMPLPFCLELLRRLQHLYDRSAQLILLQQIREKIYEYVREADDQADPRATVQSIHLLNERFYDHFKKTDPRLLRDILQLTNSDSQPSRVLLLLMACPKVKRLLIPGMLDLAGNLNPVISRLVRGRLKPQEEALRAYAERHPSSVAEFILVLTQKS
ncbi:hypothetical protein [Prevotella sp. AGR2160]|uniref:hypothetical protein n=1 Tax=Prevotella sp. AGR2160 TaxID=1280674 RepID=UPI0004231D11|nr:hypothetical protein [Prevotella sp. AGR2160]